MNERSRVVVKVLGPLEADRDGESIALGGSRPRLVLAMLAANPGRVVTIERLIDGLWEDNPPPTARKSVQVHISQLRKALGDDELVKTTPAGYTLDCEVDSVIFENNLEEANRLLASDPGAAVARIGDALSMWRQVPYADLMDNEILATERTRLIELRLHALEHRVEALLALGGHEHVLGELEVLAAENPYRERLRWLQMLALYRSGRQADALASYQATRRVLAEDLGIDPSAELRRLEQQILEQDPLLDAPAHLVSGSVISTLPARRSGLVGRDKDVEEVRQLLSTSRLVTLTGVGGCGKTRLAIEVAHEEMTSFTGGSFFVDLTTVTDDRSVVAATLLGIELSTHGPADPLEQLIIFLEARRSLLVLDNCEQVLDGVASMLDRLLSRCARLVVLTTSREPISISGEHAWRVPSLEADTPESAAVQLFVERATEADRAFQMTPGDRAAVWEICRRLDGIPLAIELAAGRARSMTVEEIRARLDDRFRLLSGGHRRSPQRQQTLAGAVAWSYELLSADEQAMLRRLSVFQGGFDPADVPAVTGFDVADSAELVDSLVAKSLVDVSWSGGVIKRRRLLETIRLFAIDQLIAADEARGTRERHFEAFVGGLRGTTYAANVHSVMANQRNIRELDNILAAVQWGAETGREKESALTVARISGVLYVQGGLPYYRSMLEGSYDVDTAETALLLSGRSVAAWANAEPDESLRVAEAAAALESDEVLDDLFAPQVNGLAWMPVDGAQERLEMLDRLLELAKRSPSAPRNVAEVEMGRAGQLYSLGRIEDALAATMRGVDSFRESLGLIWWPMVSLVALLVLTDRRSQARAAVNEAARLVAGDDQSYLLDICLGICEIGAGDPWNAGVSLAKSARRRITGREPFQEAEYLILFACYRAEIGDADRADELLRLARPRYGSIHWIAWPYVWKWSEDDFVALNREARQRELDGLAHAQSMRTAMVPALAAELEFWTADRTTVADSFSSPSGSAPPVAEPPPPSQARVEEPAIGSRRRE